MNYYFDFSNEIIDEKYLKQLKDLIDESNNSEYEFSNEVKNNNKELDFNKSCDISDCKLGEKCNHKLNCYMTHSKTLLKKWQEEIKNMAIDEKCKLDRKCKNKFNCPYKHDEKVINNWKKIKKEIQLNIFRIFYKQIKKY